VQVDPYRGEEAAMILQGRSVSPGAFEGRAHVLGARAWIEAASAVPATRRPEGEIERLRAARARACAQLERVKHQLSNHARKEDAEIFAAHLSMMGDPALLDRIESAILKDGLSAEAAVARATTALHAEFESSAMAMVQDKAADVLDIGHRLLRCLDPRVESRAVHGQPSVLIAATLTPSELVRFAHRGACAALTETCGDRSHAAILARSLGVPLLTGITRVVGRVEEGALVLIDADRGIALVDPPAEEQAEAERIRKTVARIESQPAAPRQPTTIDGVGVHLALNISGPKEAELVPRLGAVGVGLFRTEFLYMDRRSWPDEAECLAAYEETAAAVGDGDLHIRLADFGADKRPEYADFPMGRNPSLGVRGVRLLLQRDDILGPQVRALARLAERRPVTLLVPMLDSVDTLRRLRTRLEELCRKRYDTFPFQIGAMIEVPAAALSIDEILEEADLASIGLNDLTQYLMAADREDEAVQRYHDALQPAVLRLVRQVVAAGEVRDKPVSVCGELAGDPALTAALLALGVRRFSVSRPDYERVADLIERLSVSELEARREDLLRARTSSEVRRILEELRP
jgi:phosphoenolpyruvate-protein phosphotransferase